MSDINWDSLGQHPTPGDTIEGYTLEAAVGAGGMASVYRAHTENGEAVAVKILNPARVLPEERRRFTREYNALARMNHPNIVRVFKAGVHNGYPWIAMEFVDGCELEVLIERWANEEPENRFERTEEILSGLCRGLDYVHQTGLIHRDIKPSNILITKEGLPKLSDFGVVKDPNSSSTQLTMAGRLVGTVAFMAPELIAAEEVDQRADLYALGAVLYILLTDARPIEATSVAGYLARHLTEVPKAPSRHNPNVPKKLENICQRLLLKDPTHRYPTAQAILDALSSHDAPSQLIRGQDILTEQWRRRIAQLRDGAGGIVLLHGPQKIGKSILLQHFGEVAGGLGVKILQPVDEQGPLLTRLARQLEVDEKAPVKAITESLETGDWLILIDDIDSYIEEDIKQVGELMRELITRKFLPVILVASSKTIQGSLESIASGSATSIEAELLPINPLDANATVSLTRDLGLSGALCSVIGRRLCAEYYGVPGYIVEQLTTLIEHGWLEHTPLGLRGRRSIDEFRIGDLPIPTHRKQAVLGSLANLNKPETEVVELIALIDRPIRTSFILKAHSSQNEGILAIQHLISERILKHIHNSSKGSADSDEPLLRFVDPYFSRVTRTHIQKSLKISRHAAIAEALAGRRRSASIELATHLIAAERLLDAYPILINAARRAARSENYPDVFSICEMALAIMTTCESQMDYTESIRLRRWLFMLFGEAHLNRGTWDKAAEALERAIAAARLETDNAGLARCLSDYGRALYRLNQHNEAKRYLIESLEVAEAGTPERAAATRVLADISLQSGQLEEAERLWSEALDYSIANHSTDGEARARRGIAHLRTLQHNYIDASRLLDIADEMLISSGNSRVRCGIMARSIELDLSAGRYASALHRSENLIQLSDRGDMPERLSTALVLQAETFLKLGLYDRAHHSTRQALLYASSAHSHAWAIKTHSARILLDLNSFDEAEDTLTKIGDIPDAPLHAPAAQIAALRARLDATLNPVSAFDQAQWAFVQPKPPLHFRAAQIDLDIAKAFLGIGKTDAARKAAKSSLKFLQVQGTDGLRLETLLCLALTGKNQAMAEIYGKIALQIYESLPQRSAKSFANRPFIADALTKMR